MWLDADSLLPSFEDLEAQTTDDALATESLPCGDLNISSDFMFAEIMDEGLEVGASSLKPSENGDASLSSDTFAFSHSLSSLPEFSMSNDSTLFPDIPPQGTFTDSLLKICLQLSLSHIQSLTAKIQTLEASFNEFSDLSKHFKSESHVGPLITRIETLEISLNESNRKIQEFSDWSKKVERHNQESANIMLGLVDKVKKPEFRQNIFRHSTQGTLIRETNGYHSSANLILRRFSYVLER